MGLFRTHRNWAALFCRIAIVAVFLPHGLDKLVPFGLFGWQGPDAWISTFSDRIAPAWIPVSYRALLAQIIAWVEVVAAASCVLGLLVRLCILPLIADVALHLVLLHAKNGFWIQHRIDGALAPGFEYHMVLILIALGIFFSGAGSFSLDKFIAGEPDFEEYEEDIEYDDDPLGKSRTF